MISLWRQVISRSISTTTISPTTTTAAAAFPSLTSSRFFSTSSPYVAKVGIPEFLNGIGKGVEAHVSKLESEFGDLNKLLTVRTLKLKNLEIPCKHRKLILTFAHKYRLGLWRPRADVVKV